MQLHVTGGITPATYLSPPKLGRFHEIIEFMFATIEELLGSGSISVVPRVEISHDLARTASRVRFDQCGTLLLACESVQVVL